MEAVALYVMVLFAFLPGISAVFCWPSFREYPVTIFGFVGLFSFNALGSFWTFREEKLYTLEFDATAVAGDVALGIIISAVAYYAVAFPWIVLRRPERSVFVAESGDAVVPAVTAALMLAGAALYYQQTGGFLAMFQLGGPMSAGEALALRMQYAYGLPEWPLYSLVFVFLPIVLSNFAVAGYIAGRLSLATAAVYLLISVAASISLGSKAGVLNFVPTIGICLAVTYQCLGKGMLAPLSNWRFLAFAVGAVLLAVAGYVWSSPERMQLAEIVVKILYRGFVAYTDTLAAAFSMHRETGDLGVSVLPTMRGMLQHEQIILSTVLHEYQAGAPGGVSVSFLGEAFLAAGWSGLLLAAILIPAILLLLDELARLLTSGLFRLMFVSVYGYLALQLSMNGMFGSLFNFMYPSVMIGLWCVAVATHALIGKSPRRSAP